MARLALSLLGPLGVRLDGEPITAFHSDKVRALLAYLATEAGRPHRRDSLAALLWPDYPDRSARIYLSNALSHLRITLGDRDAAAPCLLADREAVQLDPNADLWVDVAAFERLVAPGPAEPQLGPQTGRLADGVALYRGPFLEGFSLSDSPPFEQWALVTRERLQRQAVEALGRLGAHHERRGELEAALACARRQLALAPWQEGAHQAVMRLLAQSGRRADALAQYEACARALREELDVEPSEETVTLYQRIRDGTLQVPLAAPLWKFRQMEI